MSSSDKDASASPCLSEFEDELTKAIQTITAHFLSHRHNLSFNGHNQLPEDPKPHQVIPLTAYLMPRIPYTMTHTIPHPPSLIERRCSRNASPKPRYRRGKVHKARA